MKMYLCSECGEEVKGHRDQCPYCKTMGDNLLPQEWGTSLEEYQDTEDYAEHDPFCDE